MGETSSRSSPSSGSPALHGSSPDVGIAGYSLGGGMGWLARKHGLQANSVTALELVTADGRRRRVDAEHEPDLFWALRGGNGNFGVVTAIEFEVYPVERAVRGGDVLPVRARRRGPPRLGRAAPDLPEEMMTWTSLIQFPDVPDVPEPLRGRPFTVVLAAFLGDEAEGRELLRPVRELGPDMDTFAMVPPAALADMAMDPSEPLPVMSTTALVSELPEVEDLMAAVGPGSGSPLPLVQLRHLGGALARRTPGAGARATLPGTYCVFSLGVPVDESSAEQAAQYLGAADRASTPTASASTPTSSSTPPRPAGSSTRGPGTGCARSRRSTTRRSCSGATTTSRRPPSRPSRQAERTCTCRASVGSSTMEELKARRVVDALRERGTNASLARVGVHQFGVMITLPDGREATWDSDDTASLEAQVMRNGVLVGFVPEIEGSDSFTEEQIIDVIVRTDYDKPIATQRRTTPPPEPALPIKGGLFRRFFDGFRYR